MWSCKCDMAVMSCSTGGSSFSVSRLVNPPQPLLCLVTLPLASSLSLISLIIASCDVMKIVIVENVTLILFLCILVPYPSLFSSPTPLVLLCVFYAMYAHLSATVYLYLSAVFDSVLWVCGLWVYRALHSHSMQYMRVQGREPGPRLWFNAHTPMDQGLGECMCWWKSNVLCLQGTACFSLSLPRLQNLVSHTNLGPV